MLEKVCDWGSDLYSRKIIIHSLIVRGAGLHQTLMSAQLPDVFSCLPLRSGRSIGATSFLVVLGV